MSEQGHRISIVKALVLCWQSLRSGSYDDNGVKETLKEKKEKVDEVRKELKIAARMLRKAVEADGSVDFAAELRPLVDADPSLEDLFGFEDSA